MRLENKQKSCWNSNKRKLEIKNLKLSIAPILGLLISLPILILIVYFLFSGSLNKEFLENNFLFEYTLNTVYLIIGTALFAIIIGIITSYLSARFEYFGSKFFSICFVLPLAYPAYIFGYTYVGFLNFVDYYLKS